MPQYVHLQLVRLPEQLPRRKRPGFGSAPLREVAAHANVLRHALDDVIKRQASRRRAEFIDPALILSVSMAGGLQEADWENLGLRILSSDSDRTLVLCANHGDVSALTDRIAAYSKGAPPGQKSPPYAGLIANIESISEVSPRDRIGRALRSEGFCDIGDFLAEKSYLLDLELWDVGVPALRAKRLDELERVIESLGGEAITRYVGPSITLMRFRGSGAVVEQVLSTPEVASVDLPPRADSETSILVQLGLGDMPELVPDAADVPLIGVIDSGISAHPLLQGIVVGQIGVPEALGTADVWGHGTAVAGVAVFGDLREQISAGALVRAARICAAKVTNDQGDFDERQLVPAQMREAIYRLRQEFGCRIFVSALADRYHVYEGKRVGAWAATLDELARELDVVIVVAAGNRYPRSQASIEEAITEYPRYLVESENRLYEPACALNVLTVGSISHGPGIDATLAQYLDVRPIANYLEPSPFSRAGPGANGALKPDLVDIGGTLVFDGTTRRLRSGKDLPAAGVVTLHHKFIDRLLSSGSGTSYAAPLVAQKAASILKTIPNASANLIRALLASSAQIPSEAVERLSIVGADGIAKICGHGRPDMTRAGYSDDSRVVLYAEDELELDHFSVYHIPVPPEFQTKKGRRTVTVTLAFDPPVRHTRNDYCGVGMSFRVVRGCSSDLVFEHYKKRGKDEAIPELADKYNCKLLPGPQSREKSTLQRASITYAKSIATYGEDYYLIVRCESGWSEHEKQRFAVVVELAHEADIKLYQQVQQRIRVRVLTS